MRILFLSHYFPPEINAPASRTFEHCKRWVREGHEVLVITCVPNHPSGKIYPGYRNRLFQTQKIDGIHVARLWTFVAPNSGFFKRSLNYLTYMMAVLLFVIKMPEADVVISTSPQFFCGLSGFFVSRIKKIPWVLEIRDLWPDSILAVGAITYPSVIRILRYLEFFAYRKCHSIVALTDSFKMHIEQRGIPSRKIKVIKNGVNFDLFNEIPGCNSIQKKLGLENKLVVSYFGTHGMAHGLEVVLKTAKRLENLKNAVFLLVGDGAEKQNLLALRERMNLNNVIMLGQVPKNQMPGMLAATDIFLVLLRKNDLFKTVIPSKIFEAMAMSLPIISNVDGECRAILEKAGCGLCIEPGNDLKLAEAIAFLADKVNLRYLWGRNGRKFVEKEFNRDDLAREYLSLIEKTVKYRNHNKLNWVNEFMHHNGITVSREVLNAPTIQI